MCIRHELFAFIGSITFALGTFADFKVILDFSLLFWVVAYSMKS